MSEWQDISTAPKDGTEILLFGHRGDQIDIGSWCGCGHYRHKTKARAAYFEKAWGSGGSMFVGVTDWQPLPEPRSPQ